MMRRIAIAALVLSTAVACSKSTAPVQADVSQLQLDAVNPTNLTFSATNGLPTEPFHVAVGLTGSNAQVTGAVFPDSLKLTTSQNKAITALRSTFETANKTDLLALNAIYVQAAAAKKAGKASADIIAILNLSKPILARLTTRLEALRVAIAALLTPTQKAWIVSHTVLAPPAGWVGPIGIVATNP
ncbi:MAG: hypothetical protein NTU67_10855 [Gemmatimonadetes bacterium]|jgi:Spy/CpxP family protein refolding chaperone|nr:hypothetical protein [Gemmatimonadota bacterium]